MPSFIVDTGPMIAALHADDRYHAWAVDQFRTRPLPFLTCESVLTEVAFVLDRVGLPRASAFDLVLAGAVVTDFDMAHEARALQGLLRQYSDQPMDLADACLVRMAELHSDCQVITVDSDFHIYRKHGQYPIPVIMPGYAAP